MESKKINQLATELTPALSDLTIIGDPTTGISKKITLSQMASLFTGTVEEYANLASFPLVGTADTIYIALDTNVIYRWNTGTSAYVELSPNIVTSLVFSDANGFDGTISLVGSTATLTITTALTQGSVPFIGASGALSQDNANLFFDDTNNRLGINTNAPTTALDVFGSGIIGRLNGTSTNNSYLGFASAGTNQWSIGNVQSDHRFRIYSEANTNELVSVLQTGEFGIGIANPTTKLHIDGGASALIANLDANVSVAKSVSFRSDNSNRINLEVSGTESGSNAGANFFIRRYSDAGALIDTPLTITRSTGAITLASALSGTSATFSGTITSGNGSGNTLNSGSIDVGKDIGLAATQGIVVNNARVLAFAATGNAEFSGQIKTTYAGQSISINAASTNSVRIQLQNNSIGNSGVCVESSTGGDQFSGTSAYSMSIGTFTARDLFLGTNSVARMKIFSSGVAAIGMDENTYGRLAIKSNSTTSYGGLNVYALNNTNFIALQQDGNIGWITSEFATGTGAGFTPLGFAVGGTQRMRIDTSGNITFGVTSTYDTALLWRQDFTGTIFGRMYTTGAPRVYITCNESGGVYLTSGATSWTANSDERLKDINGEIENAVEKLLTLRAVNFSWKSDESKKENLGLIAQDVEKQFPQLIDKGELAKTGDEEQEDKTEYLGVRYQELIPVLVAAIKELKAEIETLKEK